MVWEDLKLSDILTQASFDNATIIDMALGGSTNAMIHLIAVAGRAGLDADLIGLTRSPESRRARTLSPPVNISWKTLITRVTAWSDDPAEGHLDLTTHPPGETLAEAIDGRSATTRSSASTTCFTTREAQPSFGAIWHRTAASSTDSG